MKMKMTLVYMNSRDAAIRASACGDHAAAARANIKALREVRAQSGDETLRRRIDWSVERLSGWLISRR